VHSVSQRPNLRHLGEPLGGAEGVLEVDLGYKVSIGVSSHCSVVNFIRLRVTVINDVLSFRRLHSYVNYSHITLLQCELSALS